MSLIETKDLTLEYSRGTGLHKTAIDSLSINIEKGEVLGIIGQTGSGKSSLVQMLNGLIKPTGGKIYFGNKDIWSEPKKLRELRFKIGMVFQYPEYQLFEETVYKDIAFGPHNMGLSEEETELRVRSALKFAGLSDDFLDRSPFELSGGEKRRAAIAGVIAMDPDVLILDEPAAGLDPMGRDSLFTKILDYHRKRKNTVIIISHSMEDISYISDRILVLNEGKKLILDTTGNVFKNAELLRRFSLDIPEISELMLQLRSRGLCVNTDIFTVDGAFNEIISLLGSKTE